VSWAHPPHALLAAFAAGELDDAEAVSVALHLDECPACAAAATGLDPLSAAFASVDDPPVPDDLEAAVLAAASRPAGAPGPRSLQLLVAAGLLSAAASLLVVLGAPGQLLVGSVALAGALAATAASLAATVGPPVATATFLAGVGVAAGIVGVQRRSGRRAA
jgi:Anti-sigma factor